MPTYRALAADDSDVPGWVYQRSARVYQQFRGHGGTTLVAALLKENRLSFWCVGDSDLFLLRENKLYGLNARQEFKNDLILRALDGAFPVEEAFQDPQAGALSEYIGKEEERYTDLEADSGSHGALFPGVLRQAGGGNPGRRKAGPG